MIAVDTTNAITVEASAIGLAPGNWPNYIRHNGRQYLFAAFERNAEQEVTSAVYTEVGYDGPALVVFND